MLSSSSFVFFSFSTITLLLVSLLLLLLVSSHHHHQQHGAIFVFAKSNKSMTQLLLDREATLELLIQAAEAAVLRKCEMVAEWTPASACVVPACANDITEERGFYCTELFGKDPDTCDVKKSRQCKGLRRSFTSPTVIFPPKMSNDEPWAQEFLAYSKLVDDLAFKQFELGTVKAWVNYAHASHTGLHRLYPGSPFGRTDDNSQCTPYDNRQRQWTANALTTIKDSVIVLDSSASLFRRDCRKCRSRLELMQLAATTIINSLSFNDYFAVVTFNSPNTGTIITAGGQPVLLRATGKNKDAAIEQIQNLRSDGFTSFGTGFEKAFQILRESNATANCFQNILMLTDGTPNDRETIVDYIDQQQKTLPKPVRIFTFTISTGASKDAPRAIACANGGLHQHIESQDNPSAAMIQYLKFLGLGATNSNSSSYGEVYTDAFGLGDMVTVSKKINDRSGGQIVPAGVIGVDVPIAEFLEIGTLEELEDELFRRSANCHEIVHSDCLLQKLRNQSGFECPNVPSYAECLVSGNITEDFQCPTFNSKSAVNPIVEAGGVNAILCEPLNYDTNLVIGGSVPLYDILCCDCGLRKNVVVAIAVSSTVFICLVGAAVGIYCVKTKTKFCDKKEAVSENSVSDEKKKIDKEVDESDEGKATTTVGANSSFSQSPLTNASSADFAPEETDTNNKTATKYVDVE